MIITCAYVPEPLLGEEPINQGSWPFNVPCVAQLLDGGITFDRPVTFLVGENGSGKSTLVEAIAEAYGINPQGGRASRKKYASMQEKSPLGLRLRLDMTPAGHRIVRSDRLKKHSYFLRAETAFGFMSFVSGMPGYWEEDITKMSHGEGFLVVFDAMFREPGLYIMDEPEAALSFSSCLQLAGLLQRLSEAGSQVICATHSPLLTALPGAEILEIGDHGIRRIEWEGLELVDHWRRYLTNPSAYLRHILE